MIERDKVAGVDLSDRLRIAEETARRKDEQLAEAWYHLERINASPWWRFGQWISASAGSMIAPLSKVSGKIRRLNMRHAGADVSAASPPFGVEPGARPSIVIVAHEASRTGAPILAFNLVVEFQKRYDTIVVLKKGGDLVADFEKVSRFVLILSREVSIEQVMSKLVAGSKPIFAIVNSAESRNLVATITDKEIPVISLIHEFSCYTKPLGSLSDIYSKSSRIVFSADIVAQNSLRDYPDLHTKGYSILAQGPCKLPPSSANDDCKSFSQISDLFQDRAEFGTFIVVGMGTISSRKGVEFFLQCASLLCSGAYTKTFKFIWIGKDTGHEPIYVEYLREQVQRSGLEASFSFADECESLDEVLDRSDALFLSSRLDPLPNVAIDATLKGVPCVCFKGASGMADILDASDRTRELVVPYLDSAAAARVIGRLQTDRAFHSAVSDAVREVADRTFDMPAYIDSLDRMGRELAGCL